jgi:hypothetical protein
MCFSTCARIGSLAINVLVLPIEAFTMPFDHFILIIFLQREENCKYDNTDNNENATKVCQELTNWASTTRVHNLSGFEGSLPLWPFFHTLISCSRWPLSCSYGYELITKKLWMHFRNFVPYHLFRHTYVPIRVIHVPWSGTTPALLGLYGLSDEFFTGP